jgi:hypothetical protein
MQGLLPQVLATSFSLIRWPFKSTSSLGGMPAVGTTMLRLADELFPICAAVITSWEATVVTSELGILDAGDAVLLRIQIDSTAAIAATAHLRKYREPTGILRSARMDPRTDALSEHINTPRTQTKKIRMPFYLIIDHTWPSAPATVQDAMRTNHRPAG